MFGTKVLTSEEIKQAKFSKYQNINYAIINGVLHICKKSVYAAADKPDNAKAKINRYIRECCILEPGFAIKRSDAFNSRNKSAMVAFSDFSNKTTSITFVKPRVLIDALDTSKDANRDKLISRIKRFKNNINNLESENKHIVAEQKAAVRIKELLAENESYRNKLDAAKRDMDEMTIENVKLHNQLNAKNGNNALISFARDDGSVSQTAFEKKPTFFERIKAHFFN